MSVLDRSDLEASPLADLHVIASELGLDGFRRLRKAQLIDAIVERQGGEGGGDATAAPRATRLWCASTRSTGSPRTRWPRAPATRTCPPPSRPSVWRSAPRTPRHGPSSG